VKVLLCNFIHPRVTSLLGLYILLSIYFSSTQYFVFMYETCFHTHIKQQVKCNVLLNKSHIICVCFY
jgi:hypothetical protein